MDFFVKRQFLGKGLRKSIYLSDLLTYRSNCVLQLLRVVKPLWRKKNYAIWPIQCKVIEKKTRIFFYEMAVFLDVHVTDIKIKQFTITFERIDLQSWPLYVFSLFFHAEHNEHSKNQFQTFWKFCGGHLGFFHDLIF